MPRQKKNDLPYHHWYWGEWFKAMDVQSLNREVRCVWFEMLGRMHESNDRGYLTINGKAATREQMANMLGFGKDIDSLNRNVNPIIENGICSVRESDGALYCRRMVHEENIRKINSENGKKGGNPKLSVGNSLNRKGNRKRANANANDIGISFFNSGNSGQNQESIDTNSIESWKTKYDIYLSMAHEALRERLSDNAWLEQRREYHPGLNIEKSLEKAWGDYWLTMAGWKNKKAKRTKDIDWVATANNALSQKCNQVWISKEEREATSVIRREMTLEEARAAGIKI